MSTSESEGRLLLVSEEYIDIGATRYRSLDGLGVSDETALAKQVDSRLHRTCARAHTHRLTLFLTERLGVLLRGWMDVGDAA